MKITYDQWGQRLTIGSWKLTKRGTKLVELLGLLIALALIGWAGGVELGTINL
jgi:hypothetical protein